MGTDALAGAEGSDISCGETIVDTYAVLNSTCKAEMCDAESEEAGAATGGDQCCGGPGLQFLSGSLDGEAIQCSSPFVFGYLEMINTTFTGEEVYASQIALSLKKDNGMLDDTVPTIGAFEELVGSVCPQAFLWQTEGKDKAKDSFVEKILSYTTLDDIEADTACNYVDGNGFPLFDELTGRFILSGSADAFHFGAPVVYMPSFMEVFVWSKFKLAFKDWMAGVDVEDSGMKSLVKIKMRYVSQLAEARAESEVLSINSRPMSAADCYDDPEAENLGTPTSVQSCIEEECSVCALLAALLSITQGCLKCTGGGHDTQNLA